jgi:hypothetical protein
MHRHGPSCLEGPVSRERSGWWAAGGPPAGLAPLPLGPDTSTMSNNDSEHRKEESPIRWDLVERVRREIAAGIYETPEKLDIALSRLQERLENE